MPTTDRWWKTPAGFGRVLCPNFISQHCTNRHSLVYFLLFAKRLYTLNSPPTEPPNKAIPLAHLSHRK